MENWGESAMAGSPMTDTSTDPDTDERNQTVATILISLLCWPVLLDEYDMLDFRRIFSCSDFAALEVSVVLKKNV
jgi:hypothetical protein